MIISEVKLRIIQATKEIQNGTLQNLLYWRNWATNPARCMNEAEHILCRALRSACDRKLARHDGEYKENEDGRMIVV